MRLCLVAALAGLTVSALQPAPALSMQFRPIAVSSTEAVLAGSGPVVPGDTDRLTDALAALGHAGRNILVLALDSGGGSVVEAERMVAVIRSHRLPVAIPNDSQCASACFLLLAASPRRFAAPDAQIGVHSASQNGTETGLSLAVTTLMARDAADLGVPASIIGKMVATTPDRVAWLNPPDLALLHVTVFEGDLLTALHQAGPVAAGEAISTPPAEADAPSAYATGRADRKAWDAWLAGLQGEYREGALFARAHGDDPQPVSCYGPNNLHRGDFTLGCNIAKQRLASLLAKSRTSADYARGWNVSNLPASVVEQVEQDYQGVYFCGRDIAWLTLKVFARSDDLRRHALFVFGPHDRSANVPNGSFTVEGTIDTTGGAMILTPVKWVSQPTGYRFFGLNGRSDDGGKTFSGQVVDSATCTRFTLARVSAMTVFR